MLKYFLVTFLVFISLKSFATGVEIRQIPPAVDQAALTAFHSCKGLDYNPKLLKAFYSTRYFYTDITFNVYTIHYTDFVVEVVTKDSVFKNDESVLYVNHSSRCL